MERDIKECVVLSTSTSATARACLTIRSIGRNAVSAFRSTYVHWQQVARWKTPVNRPVEQIFFYRLAKFVMSRAIPIGLAGAVLLVALRSLSVSEQQLPS